MADRHCIATRLHTNSTAAARLALSALDLVACDKMFGPGSTYVSSMYVTVGRVFWEKPSTNSWTPTETSGQSGTKDRGHTSIIVTRAVDS